MERNSAAARHSWARQHAWLLLHFLPFPVGQTIYAHCTNIRHAPCHLTWFFRAGSASKSKFVNMSIQAENKTILRKGHTHTAPTLFLLCLMTKWWRWWWWWRWWGSIGTSKFRLQMPLLFLSCSTRLHCRAQGEWERPLHWWGFKGAGGDGGGVNGIPEISSWRVCLFRALCCDSLPF